MFGPFPFKRYTARIEKLERTYARELQELSTMESRGKVVDLNRYRRRLIARGKRRPSANQTIPPSDDM